MPDDKYEKLGPAYAEIGAEAAAIVGGDPNGIFLYAEAGDGWISASLFKDEGEIVRYFRATYELNEMIADAHSAEEEDKRWAVMTFEVTGTEFRAKFKFPDEVDVENLDQDRREAALKLRFGDKPIVYPPFIQ